MLSKGSQAQNLGLGNWRVDAQQLGRGRLTTKGHTGILGEE